MSEVRPAPHHLFAAFPIDILDQIAFYLVEDELVNLVLTGDRTLRLKARHISNVSIRWQSSTFCAWRSCKPFLASFGTVRSLSISTKRPYHLVKERLNSAFLSASLASLSLNFRGALGLLETSSGPFLALASLTYLSISQGASALSSQPAGMRPVYLASQLPAGLKHLFLRSHSAAASSYFVEELTMLPVELETFDLQNFGAQWSMKSRIMDLNFGRSHYQGAASSQPKTLTHLGIAAPSATTAVDLAPIAQNLKYLRVDVGRVLLHHEPLQRLTSQKGVPLRLIFPKLHTLLVPTPAMPCHVFETLPLSVTTIGTGFELGNNNLDNISECVRLNQLHQHHKEDAGLERPGAPRMIRNLVIANHAQFQDERLLQLLPHFPSLQSLQYTNTSQVLPFEVLPPTLEYLKAYRLVGDLTLLPRSLYAIECEILVHKEETRPEWDGGPIRTLQVPTKFTHLVSLSVKHSRFTRDIISMLPTTLETLKGTIATKEDLEALAWKANVANLLPLLSTLHIKVPYVESHERPEPIYISTESIPRSISSLKLVGSYRLLPTSSGVSLSYHQKLETLELPTAEKPSTVFAQLPKQLIRLHCVLRSQIDLNDPEMLQALLNLPPSLRKLHIEMCRTYLRTANGDACFLPVERSPSVNLLRCSFNKSPLSRLEFAKSLPTWLQSEAQLWLASENFFLSCLPRTLSDLAAPFPSVNQIGRALPVRAPFYLPTSSSWLTILNKTLQRLVVTKLPLIGLLMPSQYLEPAQKGRPGVSVITSERIRSLPPHLCRFEPQLKELSDRYCEVVQLPLVTDPSDRTRPYPESVNRLTARIFYNASNLIVWLNLWHFNIIDIGAHPYARYYALINILGSAVQVPLQFYVHRRDWSVSRERPTFVHCCLSAIAVLMFLLPTTGALWGLNYASAIGFGYATQTRPSWLQMASLGLAFVGELAVQALGHIISY